MLELDQHTIGVVAAIWQWGHFVNRTIESMKIVSMSLEGTQVDIYSWGNGPSTLIVRYPYWGDIRDESGNVWNFIVGDQGLEFKKVA